MGGWGEAVTQQLMSLSLWTHGPSIEMNKGRDEITAVQRTNCMWTVGHKNKGRKFLQRRKGGREKEKHRITGNMQCEKSSAQEPGGRQSHSR